MTDRELLELAAKAAGIEGVYRAQYAGDKAFGGVWHEKVCWNPLTDDGDALRLAVKLGLFMDLDEPIEVGVDSLGEGIYERGVDVMKIMRDCKEVRATEVHKDDFYAATRRAIVRAAAEIGKGME